MVDIIKIEELVKEYYGVEARAYPLVSYADLNYKLETNNNKYVLKLSQISHNDLEFESAVMTYLYQDFSEIIPEIIKAKNGLLINKVTLNGEDYLLRMISFCEGSSLALVKNPSPELLISFATKLAKIDKSLAAFNHPNQNRYISWDAKYAFKQINANKKYLSKKEQVLIDFYLDNFVDSLKDVLPKLRESIIHNDANDYNVLVNDTQTQITGIIDFGDSVKTHLINELAIATSYLILDKEKPFKVAAQFVASYHSNYPLEKIEIENLYALIILRLCLSVTMSTKARQDNPDNSYISIAAKPIWKFLKSYQNLNRDIATNYLKELIND